MNSRDRKWLKGFLRLGARAEKDGIPAVDVERQEETVVRALQMLDERPGLVLADEVGMGKTYEALGIAVALRHLNSDSRIVVVTPGPDLNAKWASEFARFQEMFDFGSEVSAIRSLTEFMQAVHEHPIVLAPVTMFQSGRGYSEQTYLLSLFFHWKQLHGHTANAIMARFRDGMSKRVNVARERFLGIFDLKQVEPYLETAFKRGANGAFAGLDELYQSNGLKAFENSEAVRKALYCARFALTGKLMPMLDLLIVDEAHKLKNPGSIRTQAMRKVFDGSFKKALFLTATPFQLDVIELREVFSLFSGAEEAPADLMEQVEGLLTAVSDYQRRYDLFQEAWSSLEPDAAACFSSLYTENPESLEEVEDPIIKAVYKQFRGLKTLKDETIEPYFRQWMIRSLKENKGAYRNHQKITLKNDGAGSLPFQLYERYIFELFRLNRQTHKAAVEINMVSSYAAAQEGTILASADGIPIEAEAYRGLLDKILGDMKSTSLEHPKVSSVLRDTLDAAERGEKTLIFCSRVATLEQLRRELDSRWESRILERWRLIFPGVEETEIFDAREDDEKRRRGRHSLLQSRFHRPQDPLYLALREPYLRTLVPLAKWALKHLPGVVAEANRILLGTRLGKTSSERCDYKVAKRCVEQAAANLWLQSKDGNEEWQKAISPILAADYVKFGLDLEDDGNEEDCVGNEVARWKISDRLSRLAIGSKCSLWEIHAELLDKLPNKLRVRVVEQLSRYLTYKQVPFITDLLGEAKKAGLEMEQVSSKAILKFLPGFWRTKVGSQWIGLLREFLVYFIERNPNQQNYILEEPIRTGDFARHTRDGERRERLREAFNTPLFPMVLVANEVMREGLDLHKQCRRIVHHDLEWNPAQIEQRIGRVDRLGSLTDRLRKNGGDETLDILYPLIQSTIDERIYRTVKIREKWLEFLLGGAPDFSKYAFSDKEPLPLPEGLGKDLSINLGPNFDERQKTIDYPPAEQ